MAVEFRCPDCKAKLRLAEAPPAGEEIECPRCGTVFPAPADAAARPARKPRPDGDGDAPRKKKPKPAPAADKPKVGAGAGAEGPKRRKAKKKKSNPGIMVAAIVGGVATVALALGVVYFVLNRAPTAVVLMAYLPEDAEAAFGINVSQVQKYSLFYKDLTTHALGTPNGPARNLEPVAKALGGSFDETVDYFLEGGKSLGFGDPSSALVLRTKKEFEPEKLKGLPDAKEETIDGTKVYSVPDWRTPGPEGRTGYGPVKAFAPTNRIVVLVPARIPPDKLQKMLRGNPDAKDASLVGRMGPLGKRVAKGNLWAFGVAAKPVKVGDGADAYATIGGLSPVKDQNALGSPKYPIGTIRGVGFRTNVGSRDVRYELALWCQSADQASDDEREWAKSEMSKGDDGTPPKWWKDFTNGLIREQKYADALRAKMSFAASGELFLVRSEADLKKTLERLSGVAAKVMPTP